MFVFYCPDLERDNITLSAEESKHCAKALRKQAGDTIFLTDGMGKLAEAELVVATPAECIARIVGCETTPQRRLQLHIAVAPTKNADRIEWFTEKAVEIGIEKISFIICEHSERPKVDLARLQRIAIAALKQSQTTRLPQMELLNFPDFIENVKDSESAKYIAWCDNSNTSQLVHETITAEEALILIGPEGDFSEQEIKKCKTLGFKEIKLGSRRLRTETAALYSCCAIAAMNENR